MASFDSDEESFHSADESLNDDASAVDARVDVTTALATPIVEPINGQHTPPNQVAVNDDERLDGEPNDEVEKMAVTVDDDDDDADAPRSLDVDQCPHDDVPHEPKSSEPADDEHPTKIEAPVNDVESTAPPVALPLAGEQTMATTTEKKAIDGGWDDEHEWDAPEWENTPRAPVPCAAKTIVDEEASVPGSSFLRLAGGEVDGKSGWSDGWGSILNAASTLTSTVGGGLSDVMDSIANVPSPEEMATRLPLDDALALEEKVDQMKEDWPDTDHDDCDSADEHDCERARLAVRTKHAQMRPPSESSDDGEMATPRAPNRSMADTLMSNVAESRLVAGSLDVFESVGRGAFNALTVTESDRRRFVLDTRDAGTSLSQALRERRDVENTTGEESMCPYARHFDAFGGLAQLEGLEMLADNARKIMSSTPGKDERCAKEVDERLATIYAAGDDDESDADDGDDDEVHEALRLAIEDTGLRYSAEPLMQVLSSTNAETPMECLAHVTVHSIHCVHKCAQLIMVADPLPEAAALCRLTTCLLACLQHVAHRHVQDARASTEEMTALLLESANSAEYIRQALSLLSPVLQYRVAC